MVLTDEIRDLTIQTLKDHGHLMLPTCYATTGKWCPDFYVNLPTGQVIGLKTPFEGRKRERTLYGMRGVRYITTEKAAGLLVKRLLAQYDAGQPAAIDPKQEDLDNASYFQLGMRLAASLTYTYAEHAPYGLPLLGRLGGCRGLYNMAGDRPQLLLWAAGKPNAVYNQATYRVIQDMGAPVDVWQFSRDQFGSSGEVVKHA